MSEIDHIDLEDTRLQPCMGGFCASRDLCANYLSERLQEPSERLCGADEEPLLVKRSNIDRNYLEAA